jgi:hypothetical protein
VGAHAAASSLTMRPPDPLAAQGLRGPSRAGCQRRAEAPSHREEVRPFSGDSGAVQGN